MRGELELRCACSARPLLGVCGRDRNGEPFVHIKVHKQGRIFGEMVAVGGTVHVRCRNCQRWHIITIRRGAVDFEAQQLPPSIEI